MGLKSGKSGKTNSPFALRLGIGWVSSWIVTLTLLTFVLDFKKVLFDELAALPGKDIESIKRSTAFLGRLDDAVPPLDADSEFEVPTGSVGPCWVVDSSSLVGRLRGGMVAVDIHTINCKSTSWISLLMVSNNEIRLFIQVNSLENSIRVIEVTGSDVAT